MNKKEIITNLKDLKGNIQQQIDNKADIDHTHDDLVSGAPAEHQHEIKDINGLQNELDGKAKSSHTHTRVDISDFPKSLPADGGNADTVGGELPSAFAKASHTHNEFAKNDHTHKMDNIEGLNGEINNLKSSVSSGKNAIASAITSKGTSASGSEDFASLANKIQQLQTSEVRIESGSTPDDIVDIEKGETSSGSSRLPVCTSEHEVMKVKVIGKGLTGTINVKIMNKNDSALFKEDMWDGRTSYFYYNSKNSVADETNMYVTTKSTTPVTGRVGFDWKRVYLGDL